MLTQQEWEEMAARYFADELMRQNGMGSFWRRPFRTIKKKGIGGILKDLPGDIARSVKDAVNNIDKIVPAVLAGTAILTLGPAAVGAVGSAFGSSAAAAGSALAGSGAVGAATAANTGAWIKGATAAATLALKNKGINVQKAQTRKLIEEKVKLEAARLQAELDKARLNRDVLVAREQKKTDMAKLLVPLSIASLLIFKG